MQPPDPKKMPDVRGTSGRTVGQGPTEDTWRGA